MPNLRDAAVQGMPPRVVAQLDAWAAAGGIQPDDASWVAVAGVVRAALPVLLQEAAAVRSIRDDAVRTIKTLMIMQAALMIGGAAAIIMLAIFLR